MRLSFGACLFDSCRRGLWRDGTQVRLSPKAFHLLEMLIERRPDAVAQQEIYDELWPDTIVDFANLHNLVSQVRAAIGDADHSALRTVYGFGFSFDAPGEEVAEERASARSVYVLLLDQNVYPLRLGVNLVGRSAAADVKVIHPSLSRSHSRLIVGADGVAVEDLGSRNGTFVNGKRIDGVRDVTSLDELLFGALKGRLVSEESVTEEFLLSEKGLEGEI